MKAKTKIRIRGDLFLGKRIPVGTPGVILRKQPGGPLYWVLLDGDRKVYTLAPAEFTIS